LSGTAEKPLKGDNISQGSLVIERIKNEQMTRKGGAMSQKQIYTLN